MAPFQLMLPEHKEGSVLLFIRALMYVPSPKQREERVCLRWLCWGGAMRPVRAKGGIRQTEGHMQGMVLGARAPWWLCPWWPSLQPLVPPDAHGCLEGCESTLCSWLLFKDQQQLSTDRGCVVLIKALFPVSASSTCNRFGCEHPDRTA